jgi:hypothetical protein
MNALADQQGIVCGLQSFLALTDQNKERQVLTLLLRVNCDPHHS